MATLAGVREGNRRGDKSRSSFGQDIFRYTHIYSCRTCFMDFPHSFLPPLFPRFSLLRGSAVRHHLIVAIAMVKDYNHLFGSHYIE
jgi:hypothetical protein